VRATCAAIRRCTGGFGSASWYNRRGAVNKWTSGARYLRGYPPVHRRVRIGELVRQVDGFLAAMQDGWPQLTMPTILQDQGAPQPSPADHE
jgi:hypothetical protein